VTTTDQRSRRLDQLLRVVGLVTLLVIAVFPYAGTPLVAPVWAVGAAWAMWAVTAVLTWRIGRHRPRLTPLVPFAAVAAWFLMMIAGELIFGWTA
jgi:hypothetical protein